MLLILSVICFLIGLIFSSVYKKLPEPPDFCRPKPEDFKEFLDGEYRFLADRELREFFKTFFAVAAALFFLSAVVLFGMHSNNPSGLSSDENGGSRVEYTE